MRRACDDTTLRACEASGNDLAAAFELRRNVVNLKKVLLHSWHAAEPLEKELRRLSTFWRYDMCFENGVGKGGGERGEGWEGVGASTRRIHNTG